MKHPGRARANKISTSNTKELSDHPKVYPHNSHRALLDMYTHTQSTFSHTLTQELLILGKCTITMCYKLDETRISQRLGPEVYSVLQRWPLSYFLFAFRAPLPSGLPGVQPKNIQTNNILFKARGDIAAHNGTF